MTDTMESQTETMNTSRFDFFRGVAFTVIAAGAAGAVPADISGEPKYAATVALVTMFALGLYEVAMSGEIAFVRRKLKEVH